MFQRIALALLGTLAVTPPALAAEGSFSTLTYNVAGLPQGLSSAPSDRLPSTQLISGYVNAFDIVHVQEDFNYHAALYDSCDTHPYRSPTSGGAAFGSGLNTLSRFFYDDWERVKWNDCNGVDCLTPKGFTLSRVRLEQGVYVDVYNLHAQAQVETADLAARRKNILQLAGYIDSVSAGRAVIVMGDTNTRYTRDQDNPWELLHRGFSDVWVELIRAGSVPAPGAPAMVCDPPLTRPDCEIVDKVLYRNNAYVKLNPLGYLVRTDAQNAVGQELSDHPPLEVDWAYSTATQLQLSDEWGGPHGNAFDDVNLLPQSPAVNALSIRSGERIDQVEISLTSGAILSHGGSGGSLHTLALAAGEFLNSVTLCSGEKDGHTRVFHAEFRSNWGRTLAGGSNTSSCTTYSAPPDFQIVGFHGRADSEVDRLGVVYARRPAIATSAASYVQIKNRASGRCLDVSGARVVAGQTVQQWDCNGGDWQKWSYDVTSGLLRNKQDPRYCLDNSGKFADGSSTVVWPCTGSANQRFTVDPSAGTIAMRSYPIQVLDGNGSSVSTWSYWGGQNQTWSFVP